MNHQKNPGEERPGTVLIVDDDAAALQLTQRVMEGVCPEFRLTGLNSGAELIDYIKGERQFSDRVRFPYPVLILLDLAMPEMHGFEVLAWLATHPPHNGVPVIVLTGSGEVLVAKQAYALGARSFLTKPLNPQELNHTMDGIGKFENRPRQKVY